mgnify:CR=1 FL=1
MRERHFYVEIFAVCFAAILLEISYTRVFSFKLYYYFSYLIIGIALLGIGAGGVLVALSDRLRATAVERLIVWASLAGATTTGVGYLVVSLVQLNAAGLPGQITEIFKLVIICTAVFLPFLSVGVVIASVFSAAAKDINRLYFADLAGAGLACAASVPAMYLLTPPGCVMLAGMLLALTALRGGGMFERRAFAASTALAGALGLAVIFARFLPDPIPDSIKTLGSLNREVSPVAFSRWSPVFRVDVVRFPGRDGAQYLIAHDGQWGSALHPFDGNFERVSKFHNDPRAYPFAVLGRSPEVLIIGAAGGHEILASLFFDARHVTGVELNPITVSLLTHHFADLTGRIAYHPRVSLVNAEGRSYLRSHDRKYDLIWLVAPDTYAAMNAATSGAFVLSESYLYTAEMLRDSVERLHDGGVVCAQFGELFFDRKPNRTLRYLATARQTLAEMGVSEFGKHVMVATSPDFITLSTILLKASPFTTDEVERFVRKTASIPGAVVRHAPGYQVDDGLVRKVITLPQPELERWWSTYPYDVRPVTDDSPFFWHFTPFRQALFGTPTVEAANIWDWEDSTGERVLVVLLVFAMAFAMLFLLAPFAAIPNVWVAIPYKFPAALYFGALGIGFMFLEIPLIQKLTLFLGYPTYSLSVTLFAILVFTGLGSLWSERYRNRRDLALASLFAALVLLAALYRFGLGPLMSNLVGAPLAVRILLSVACLAPLGFVLGAFLPLGIATLEGATEHSRVFVAWGWAVNGYFSVTGSVLSTILAMAYGFNFVMLLAVGIYAVGILALRRIPAPVPSRVA